MILALDIDQPIIRTSWEVDIGFLNSDAVKALRSRLEEVEYLSKIEQDLALLNNMISESFTKFFLTLIGDCSQHIKSSCQGPSTLDYKQFLRSPNHCENIRGFLHDFIKTAMFNSFIDSKFRVPIFCSTHKEPIGKSQPLTYLVHKLDARWQFVFCFACQLMIAQSRAVLQNY